MNKINRLLNRAKKEAVKQQTEIVNLQYQLSIDITKIIKIEARLETLQQNYAQLHNNTCNPTDTRMWGSSFEHKHAEFDYWHPASKPHNKEN